MLVPVLVMHAKRESKPMALFEARSLTVSYRQEGMCHPVVSKADITLERAKIYDLAGKSGSGKSTLLRACALLLGRETGELLLEGVPSSRMSPQQWRRNVCLVPQKTALFPGTVEENLLLPWTLAAHAGDEAPSRDDLCALLRKAALDDLGLSDDVARLSGGQAARISLLRVFACRPKVLLLDEVDAALDNDTSQAISALTAQIVTEEVTCLRIRHRGFDGLAEGVFTLHEGNLTYAKNGPLPVEASAKTPGRFQEEYR